MRLRCLAIAIAVLCAAATVRRSADAATDDDLIERGIQSMRAGEYEGALRDFIDANAHSPTPKAVAQIGLAEQALGRWADAEIHLSQALGNPTDRWIRKYQGVLTTALTAVKAHLGSIVITGTPPGAELRLDGQVIGTLPLNPPARVPRGGHALEVKADGHKSLTLPVIVAADELLPVRVALEREPPMFPRAASAAQPITSPTKSPLPSEAPSADRTIAWIGLVASAIVGAAGVLLYTLDNPRLGTGGIAFGIGGAVGAGAGLVVLEFP